MRTVRVTTAGLEELAAVCAQEAARAVPGPAPTARSTLEASAEAVASAHAGVGVAGRAISERLTWTGEKAASAGAAYDAHDAHAAARINAVRFGAYEI